MTSSSRWEPDVDVSSPDRSVRILATVDGQIEVAVRDLHRHTDDTLARQVRAAARVALAALQRIDLGARNRPGSGEPAGAAPPGRGCP
jgi:hypothetical protein